MTDDELALVARMAFYDATKHSADPWPAIAVAIRAKVIEECVEAIDTQKYRGCDEFGVGHEQGCEDAIAAIRALKEKTSD